MKRKGLTPTSPTCRSKVTNGSALFAEGGDGRSAWARRFRDLCRAHAADLGGADIISEAQASLIRRVSTLEVELEQMETTMASGGEIDLDAYSRAAGHLRRILETLGIERRQRDASPTLADIIKAQRAGGA